MYAAIDRAERLVAAAPDKRIILHQFKNPANPRIHLETTGPEIWDDTDGAIDVLVAGVGTGGTISGVSQYIKKKKKKKIISVAVEPEHSPVIQQTLDGLPIRPGYHAVQGIGAGFIPDTLDLKMVDRVEPVGDDEAIEYAKRLAQEEGLLCGISCGAAAAVACRLARQPEFEGKTIVVILPDAGERYLSSPLFDSIS
jgi:cysteine synthase A